MKLVCFYLGEQEFGLDIKSVCEVIETPVITPVHYAPDSIAGVINLRGEIITVIHLAELFSLENADSGEKVIVVENGEGGYAGFMIHHLSELKIMDDTCHRTPPDHFSDTLAGFITTVLEVDGSPLAVLETDKILYSDKIANIAPEH